MVILPIVGGVLRRRSRREGVLFRNTNPTVPMRIGTPPLRGEGLQRSLTRAQTRGKNLEASMSGPSELFSGERFARLEPSFLGSHEQK